MVTTVKTLSALLVCLCALPVAAQELPELPGPVPEHDFLKRFVGQWTSNSVCETGPNQPSIMCEGEMNCRMLGEFWMISESSSSMMDMQVQAVMTIGYDPEKKKYVGTWVDSAFNRLWNYEGTVTGDTLTLDAQGPNFITGEQNIRYQDIYSFKSADEIEVTSKMQIDGDWVTFVRGTAKRVKDKP